MPEPAPAPADFGPPILCVATVSASMVGVDALSELVGDVQLACSGRPDGTTVLHASASQDMRVVVPPGVTLVPAGGSQPRLVVDPFVFDITGGRWATAAGRTLCAGAFSQPPPGPHPVPALAGRSPFSPLAFARGAFDFTVPLVQRRARFDRHEVIPSLTAPPKTMGVRPMLQWFTEAPPVGLVPDRYFQGASLDRFQELNQKIDGFPADTTVADAVGQLRSNTDFLRVVGPGLTIWAIHDQQLPPSQRDFTAPHAIDWLRSRGLSKATAADTLHLSLAIDWRIDEPPAGLVSQLEQLVASR